MAENVSTTLSAIRSLEKRMKETETRVDLSTGGGGGGGGEMNERIAKLEGRIDGIDLHLGRIAAQLDALGVSLHSVDQKISSMPSKEFIATTVIGVGGISLAAALAFAALTFNVADYVSKTTQQAEQVKSAPSSGVQQPIVIMVPSTASVQPASEKKIVEQPPSVSPPASPSLPKP